MSPPSELDSILAPEREPSRAGRLRVSPRHELAWEVLEPTSERGVDFIVLHGGPGVGTSPAMRRFFDPARDRVLLFDQRGAGRSTPRGEWRDNTTNDLVDDIDRLREAAGFEDRPVVLFGGSWGATLALAYAQRHPAAVAGLVLRGLFLGRRRDIDHFYHGGTAPLFPDAWTRLRASIPRPERFDYPDQLFVAMTTGDERSRDRAVREFARYELLLSEMGMTDEACDAALEGRDVSPVSLIENHYMRHGLFLREGELLEGAARIRSLPAYLVTGRYDVICPPIGAFELAERLDDETPTASHSWREPALARALMRGIEHLRVRVASTGSQSRS